MLCIIESFAKSLNAFLEPVGNGPIRQTAHEFLLVLHSNYGPILYCSEIKFDTHDFFIPLHLIPPLGSPFWNIAIMFGIKN